MNENVKYLFLDVDGVLNSGLGGSTEDFLGIHSNIVDLESKCLYALRYLVKHIDDIHIILTTSWIQCSGDRPLKVLNNKFKQWEIPSWVDTIRKEIYECTPNSTREKAITLYCNRHNINMKSIIVLDDEELIFNNDIQDRFIRIDTHDGLTFADYRKVCKFLNVQEQIFRQ